MNDGIRHAAPDCQGTPYETVGRLGNRLLRCPECRRFVVLRDPGPGTPRQRPSVAPRAAAAVDPAPECTPTPASGSAVRFVCATHGGPVSWHGRDCPECRADHERRQRERAQR